MAHKTFISYKYSESKEIRDRILEALGDDASFYSGETSESPDMSDLATTTIKRRLSDMIHGTTVTIVVLSPNMKQSEWMDWEIRYSLRQTSRGDRSFGTNGIVCVVGKFNGGYDWLRTVTHHADGCESIYFDSSKLPEVINLNRFNQTPKEYACEECGTVDGTWGCYASIVTEEEFLANPAAHIENAFVKRGREGGYDIHKDPR